jgi:ubiquinone/menaquinone biosynthesis C-methylase UbiE
MTGFGDSTERHVEELERTVPLPGKAVLDVGCGGGGFLRALARRGATVAGVEIDEGQLARARAAGLDESCLHVGRAEALPFADASFDVVCCIFTLHHFPADVQDRAFAEAARVLRPGGALFIVEPTPAGALTEVLKPIEDETEVRTRSIALLRDGATPGLARRSEAAYEVARRFDRAEDLMRMAVDVDPLRAARVDDPAIRAEVQARFARHAEPDGSTFWLRQPCVAVLFERAATG